MALRIILSATVLCCFVLWGIMLGGNVLSFVDMASICIVFGCIASGATWSFSLTQIKDAFAVALRGVADDEKARQAHFVFYKMAEFSVGAGLIGTLIGLVKMLQNLDDPTTIGPAMAVALLTLLYGVIIGEFVFKAMANSCLSQNHLFEREQRRGFVSFNIATGSLFVILSALFVMLLAMSG